MIPDVRPDVEPGTVRLPLVNPAMTWPMTLVTAAGKPPSRALQTLLDLLETESAH